MRFDLWAFDNLQIWTPFPTRAGGYLLTLAYLLLIVWLLQANWREWREMTRARLAGLLVVLALGSLASGVFLIFLPGPETLPLPNVPDVPEIPGAPLFGAVAILLIGGWMGVGPAILVGILSGIVRAVWLTGRGPQVVEVALLAGLVAFLLRQNYRGRGFAWLRRPFIAGAIGGLAAAALVFPSALTSTSPGVSILSAGDFAWSLTWASILPNLLEWIVAGLLVELVFARLPTLRPQRRPLLPPPYEYSLTRRFLYVLLPAFLVTIIILVAAVTNITTNSATDLTLKQMAHDAKVASDAIPNLNLISANLLAQFAQQEALRQDDQDEQQAVMDQFFTLEELLRTTAYFRQLVVFDEAGGVIRFYPESAIPLTEDERVNAQDAATKGYPGSTHVWVAEYGVPMLSHVEPIRGADGQPIGALLGRVDLRIALGTIVSSLQGTVGAGRGFIVGDQWKIIAHPNPDRLMQPWAPEDETVQELDDNLDDGDLGHAYEGVGPNGTRQLVYHLQGSGHPWTVVVIVPYERVLSLATEIAGPLAGFLAAVGVALMLVLTLLINRLTQPLSALAQAAGAMAHRDLETPVLVSGEDEVGRLGHAFEQMRQALRDRLSELQLLLGVSQGAAASLNLSQGLPPILDGALEATGADGVRIVAISDKKHAPLIYAKGTLGAEMATLDAAIARLVRHESSLRLDNTARTRAILDTHQLTDQVGAILALPLRTPQGYQGILWIAYRNPHAFIESEVGFMTTLAGQASVLIENAQLFEAAEGGRRRLAAILASTSDAVIVTDQRDRILLLNPAAEADFGVSASQIMGQPVSIVLSNPGLVSLLTGEHGDNITREVELADGRVLYASASFISSDDSRVVGRVAVLRDITHLKELDEMKTEFVNTVSHDLRSPLTYMRGYVTMLPMIGELSTKQKEYVDKILSGIDQMSKLVEDLLSLARIESDMGRLTHPIKIGELVKAVANRHRTYATSKDISLDVQVAKQIPIISGDPALLRQAITNLVDNAIKYTPSGEVNVRVYPGKDHVVIQVQDTGPGISQADQVRLFERFFRVKRRDSLEIKGTGLGLAIVKSIIERRHGGRVWVESQLGAGSSFFIVLPVESDQGNGQ